MFRIILMTTAALLTSTGALAQDATNGAGEANHAKIQSNRAMATYWRAPTKPEVRQVESRTLTGKRSCTMYVDSAEAGNRSRAAQQRTQDAANAPQRSNQATVIKESLVNKC
jgi:hypothetical protein